MIKPKPTKEDLREKAELVIKQLEAEEKEILLQIDLLNAKVNDIERKIRWLRREIIE